MTPARRSPASVDRSDRQASALGVTFGREAPAGRAVPRRGVT